MIDCSWNLLHVWGSFIYYCIPSSACVCVYMNKLHSCISAIFLFCISICKDTSVHVYVCLLEMMFPYYKYTEIVTANRIKSNCISAWLENILMNMSAKFSLFSIQYLWYTTLYNRTFAYKACLILFSFMQVNKRLLTNFNTHKVNSDLKH